MGIKPTFTKILPFSVFDTHLVRLFCFLIKSFIHEFQYFDILETSPYSRVLAFFALWFWWNYKILIIHVSCYVLFFFPNIQFFSSIFAFFFLCNKLKTHKIYFSGNIILFFHIGWFASVLAFFYVHLLKDTFSVILFWISI